MPMPGPLGQIEHPVGQDAIDTGLAPGSEPCPGHHQQAPCIVKGSIAEACHAHCNCHVMIVIAIATCH